MAAVAAEPGVAVPSTTRTAATNDDVPPEPRALSPELVKEPVEPICPWESGTKQDNLESGEGRHVRPELEPAAGKGSGDSAVPLDRTSVRELPVLERISPCLPAESESGGTYRSIMSDPQPSAVFLHSLPDPPPVTEAGLSLAEPAEPTTNVTTDRAEGAERDRAYTALIQAELGVGPTEDSVLDSDPECPKTDTGYCESSAAKEEPAGRSLRDSSPKQEESPGTGPLSVLDLSLGSEVRVMLDHVIDDALVVSFRLGEQVFSGVLMDVSKRFGPYGIPITVFPRRDEHSRPLAPSQPVANEGAQFSSHEEVSLGSAPQPWSSKPPPLFQEGAPYPPPIFIRDTYNQALPQPPPRKIKRPKRRYRCEEPTSIMNAIKLRPRQVLCDKCKGVVASGGHREARRGLVELRSDDACRRRRPADVPMSSELKRLRIDDKAGNVAAERRSSGIRVSPASSSSSRVLRGVSSSSSSAPSSRLRLKLNSKKILTKGSAADCSKARQVFQKLAPHRQPKDQKQNNSKTVTRANALQNHNQKVHFTRRLQHLSSTAGGSHKPLPPRMRLKPQRYRTDEPKTCSSTAAPKPAASPPHTPSSPLPPPRPAAPPRSAACGELETLDGEVVGQGADWQEVEPPPPSSSSPTLDSSNSECSSTETFDLPPPGDPPSSYSGPTPPPSTSSTLASHCPASSSPAPPPAEGEDEDSGDMKRRRKSSTSSSSSSSSSSSVFTKSVSKCFLPDGRSVCVGDIVWAKIYGFPWWPARVLGITVARRSDTGLAVRQEARVSWFGSPTTSFLPLVQLSPFLETFQSRFDKKRKGPYRRAISEAASAAKQLTPEVRALLTQFET